MTFLDSFPTGLLVAGAGADAVGAVFDGVGAGADAVGAVFDGVGAGADAVGAGEDGVVTGLAEGGATLVIGSFDAGVAGGTSLFGVKAEGTDFVGDKEVSGSDIGEIFSKS